MQGTPGLQVYDLGLVAGIVGWRPWWTSGSDPPGGVGEHGEGWRLILRWVFQLFLWVRVAELNLEPHHERVARLLKVRNVGLA
ncbi:MULTISPECIES: hypothetical protein [unclassified Meiothermus]|uniref:hypothetical protein n=1 Tax=unclassified Meiothermus TaxID=370471 RepID=UPI000D7BB5DA|nr:MULTISPECIES: hypothetical protein [unclassified Meiothermus]PZA08489.1 hypothetical protein DNA98_00080 [Meiothermus sp. Pnk-1]RYM36903.1 hypothetical protein EWH23_08190 [Meiothermus sp. PNK-Is4]